LSGEIRNLAVSVHRMADGAFQYDFTFDRDAAGRSGVGVPDGHATKSRRSALESAPGNMNRSFWPGKINANPVFSAKVEAVKADLQTAWNRMSIPDEARLRVVDHVFGMDPDGNTVLVDGLYVRGLVQVALDSHEGSLATLHHEAIHALRDAALWGGPSACSVRESGTRSKPKRAVPGWTSIASTRPIPT